MAAQGTRFDIVTVVFGGELPLLDLQARSLARFVDPRHVDRIRIVVNDPDPAPCLGRIEGISRPLLGPLADRLVVTTAPVAGVPGSKGWLTQQACKLAISADVAQPHYLLLDAKTHLIRPLARRDLFDGDRVRMPFLRQRGDPAWLEDAARFFGLNPAALPARMPPSIPPFVMRTDRARALVAEIASRTGRDPYGYFLDKSDRSTEFTLYVASLLAAGELDTLVSPRAHKQPMVRKHVPVPGTLGARLAEAQAEGAWALAIHRRRYRSLGMNEDDPPALARFWAGIGLFADEAEAGEAAWKLIRWYRARATEPMMQNRVQVEVEVEVEAAAEAAARPDSLFVRIGRLFGRSGPAGD